MNAVIEGRTEPGAEGRVRGRFCRDLLRCGEKDAAAEAARVHSTPGCMTAAATAGTRRIRVIAREVAVDIRTSDLAPILVQRLQLVKLKRKLMLIVFKIRQFSILENPSKLV